MYDYSEEQLIETIEAGQWNTVSNLEAMKARLRKAAAETGLKDYRINVRIAKRDVEALKTRALEQGIPYQTLVTSILHRYVTGSLQETG
jgi:predicted DNA binding CopG/RHH family protein